MIRFFATLMTSSACVERVFSMMSEAHRPRLNRLKAAAVRVRLMTRCNAEIVSLVLCMPALTPAPPVAYNKKTHVQPTPASVNPVTDGTQIMDGEDPVDDAELADPTEPIEYEPLAAAHAHAGTAEEGAAAEAAALAAVAAAEEPVAVRAQTLVWWDARCLKCFTLCELQQPRRLRSGRPRKPRVHKVMCPTCDTKMKSAFCGGCGTSREAVVRALRIARVFRCE